MARPGIFSRAISVWMNLWSSGILRAIGMSGAGVNGSGATSFNDGWHPSTQLAISTASNHDVMLAGRTLANAEAEVVVEPVENLHHSRVMLRRISHHHAVEHQRYD
jgi:hypothetical protein